MDKPRALLTAGRRLRGFLALTVLPAFATAPVVHGQCQYEVTAIIQGPNCFIVGPQPTFAQGMNVHGHVAGYYWDCETTVINHAFVWKPETGLVTLPLPEGPTSARAVDINDHGMVIGAHSFTGVGWKAWVYDPQTQEYTYLEPLHEGATATDLTVANAINNNGVVAGARVISKPGESPPIRNAVIWDTNTGDVIDLGVMCGPNSVSNDLNDDGDTVGWTGTSIPNTTGFVSTSRELILFDKDFAATTSNATSINSYGVIGGNGRFFGSSFTIGFVLSTELILIEPLPGFTQCGVRDVNDAGQAVLVSTSGNAPGLWQHGVHHALSPLVLPSDPAVTILQPIAINNEGQIITRGTLSGKTVGILLAPVGVPTADFNFDCKVDVHDLLKLLLHWGPAPDSKFDLNGDGVVNVFDLLLLLANWG